MNGVFLICFALTCAIGFFFFNFKFEEKQLLALLFRLASPNSPENLVSPLGLIQTFTCLHGLEGPSNQAQQNLRAFTSIYLGPGSRESRYVPSLSVNIMDSFHKYPAVTFPAFRFQRKFQSKFFGERFWSRKKDAFAEARENLITSNFQ